MPVPNRALRPPRLARPLRPLSRAVQAKPDTDPAPEALLAATRRHTSIYLREALAGGYGPTRGVTLTGAAYAGMNPQPFKNDGAVAVAVWVEVVTAGALGAKVFVKDTPIVADTPGARSRVYPLDPNESLTVRLTDPAVKAVLHIATPEAAIDAR